MIPVAMAAEPPSFDAHVRKRGADAIQRLLGKPVKAKGRKPKTTYARPQDIPGDAFPTCWTDVRKQDKKSTLDDMMNAYGQLCAYLGMRLERATGSPTVDHFVPKDRDWKLVYEWSNYRLAASCVNGAKGTRDVVDPFKVKAGWIELDLATFLVRRGKAAPASEHARIDATLEILNLRQCVAQRGEYITAYLAGHIELPNVERYAPFVAGELRRQGALFRGDRLRGGQRTHPSPATTPLTPRPVRLRVPPARPRGGSRSRAASGSASSFIVSWRLSSPWMRCSMSASAFTPPLASGRCWRIASQRPSRTAA